MSGVGWQPAPEGFRPVQYNRDGTQRGSLDRAEEARAAKQKALSETRKREATETDSLTAGRPGSEAPVDVLDAALLALRAEPHHLHSADSHGTLTMDTPEAKRARDRARLDAAQAQAAAAIERAAEKEKAEKAEAEDEYKSLPWLNRTAEEDDALIEQDEETDAFIEAGADDDFQWLRDYDGTKES